MEQYLHGSIALGLGVYLLLTVWGVLPIPVRSWETEEKRQSTRRLLSLLGSVLVLIGLLALLGYMRL